MSATSATPAGTAARPLPQGCRTVAVIVLIPALVALALWAFAWPAARTAPRDLPLGVAGSATAQIQIQKQLAQHRGAFEIHRYADEAAARDAIEDRTVYGAVVATPQGPKLLTASAASPLVAQLLQQAVAQQAPEGTKVMTTDVVPASAKDPRGAALSASVLPLALVGIAAGAVVTLLGLRGAGRHGRGRDRAQLAGGLFSGDWCTEAAALGLSTLAVGAAVAGLAALIGPPGIGLGGFVIMLLGNPFSGAASAPEMLPEPVGAIGQWLPPGAGASLLRSVSFFDGAAAAGPALTLAWWAALGLGAVLLGSTLKQRGTTAETVAEREPALVN